jgi:cell division protein FtsB
VRRLLLLMLSIGCLLASSTSSYGQGNSPELTEERKREIARALIIAEECPKEVAARDEEIAALRQKIALQAEIVATQDRALAAYRDAAQALHAADALSDKIEASYKASLDAFKKRVAELEAEISRLKGQRKYIAGVSAILGAALAHSYDQ